MDGRGRHGERRHRGVGAVASAPAAFRVRVWEQLWHRLLRRSASEPSLFDTSFSRAASG